MSQPNLTRIRAAVPGGGGTGSSYCSVAAVVVVGAGLDCGATMGADAESLKLHDASLAVPSAGVV